METEGDDIIGLSFRDAVAVMLTIEEGVEIVIVDFAEFEKVFARFWAGVYFEINDDVAQRCLKQDRHDQGRSVGWRKRKSATPITRDEARRSANVQLKDRISTISSTVPSVRGGDTMTTLFSQHSSNPLEVSSSDVHNARRIRMLQACGGVGSSDDYTLAHSGEGTTSGWDAKTLNGKASLQKRPAPLMVDLDEDMSDDDTACEPGTGVVEEEEETQVDEQVDDEDEEERTILLKPPDEQEQIAEEILDLEEAVPQLREDYKIVDRLGTGTFSSVYKAIDLWYHTKWYNSPWHNRHPPNSSAHYQSEPRPKGSKAFVAIKRIYVTSGPDRIRNEISIMDDCRGSRHVSQLVTAFRHHDQIVVVMPYHRNDDFRVRVCQRARFVN